MGIFFFGKSYKLQLLNLISVGFTIFPKSLWPSTTQIKDKVHRQEE